jgi:hypothetical protein
MTKGARIILVGLAGATVVSFALLAALAWQARQPPPRPIPADELELLRRTPDTPPVRRLRARPITMADYAALAPGTSYAEALDALGPDGEQVSMSAAGEHRLTTYVWRNTDGSTLTVTFQDGAVAAKSQHGLR